MKNKLREYRKKQNLSQNELASKSSVSRITISKIENSKLNNIESSTMLKLAIALGCDVSDIFFREVVVFSQQKGN